MPETFGGRLRRRREEQHIALITIAEQTKIKLSLLEALERDDVSHWPAGIFRRAFLRAYAQAINLNPDVVVRKFLEVHPEPAEVVEPAIAAAAARANGGPPTRLRSMLSRLRRSPVEDVAADATAGPAGVPARAGPPSPVAAVQPSSEPDFLALADLCTEFGRVQDAGQLEPLLRDAARILDARGLIVWLWDALTGQLKPTLVHGYSEQVLAQLPAVGRDGDNATAAAFRLRQTCAVKGSEYTSGALVTPLLTATGCAGVLAIELQNGREQARSVRAGATILAALLAQLTGVSAELQPESVEERFVPRDGTA